MNDLSHEIRVQRIIYCHNGIHRSMKQALNYALEAGELLIQQKEQIGHGNFLVWLKANVPFSDRTARRYIRLCEYSDKLASVSDLQEAYRQVETLEAQEKKRKEQENKEKILAFKKTGEKPSTWDRSTDYQLKKQDDEEAYQRRKEEAFKPKEYSNPRITQEEINEALNITDRLSKQLDQDHRLNLSSYADNLTQQKMFGEIEHYINSFKTVSSQLEATHNLIKKIKLIANDLQRHTYEAVNH